MITTLKDWSEKLPNFLADKTEHLLFSVQQETEAGYGFDNDINSEYCRENNIPAYDQKRNGGTVVFSKGNITLALIYNNRVRRNFTLDTILSDLCKYLTENGIEVTRDNNDIIVNGFKVASASGYNFGEKFHWTYDGVQISINQDLEAIKNICLKPMVKVPKGLSEYGITTEEIYQWCVDWLISHDIDLSIN